jgi:predicted NAD/FAD-binding protein
MSAAVWSMPMERMLDFPAATLIRFFKNHGFLGLNTQHQWYTPVNGSESYKQLLVAPFKHRIQTGNAVTSVARENDRALLHTRQGQSLVFDKVVFACHADQALGLLQQPTGAEQQLLSPFHYQYNKVTVHTDESVMPRSKRAWSSWNYRVEQQNGRLLPTTIYWMNRLQGVSDKKNYFVSVNALPGSIAAGKVLREIDYEHPLFDVPAIRAQRELPQLNRQGLLYYCGSYFKYGFHEDAYASAVELCKLLTNE